MSRERLELDVVIVGGGIAGLWTLNRLSQMGFSVVLLESQGLGGGQSIASQGVVHGGMKYAVGGSLTEASEALAAMPHRWRSCFEGSGEIDLSRVDVLAPCQYLWSTGTTTSAVAGFFASKLLSSRIDRLSREDFPQPLDHPSYRGQVFRLEEMVVDTATVLRELARPWRDRILRVDWKDTAKLVPGPGKVVSIDLQGGLNGGFELRPRHTIFAAGWGNDALLQSVGLHREIPMQRRPLHQVLVKKAGLPAFYSVCLGGGPKPPIVCTTHRHPDGERVWYLGGQLAESGVDLEPEAQIEEAKQQLAKLLPFVDLEGAQWATLRIDRAEASTADATRHPGAFVQTEGSITAVWPSKLALAPNAADRVIDQLVSSSLTPGESPVELPAFHLPFPDPAPAPWETLF